ncbi:unnamed protein product [Pleuronectes platessa]|uniref:Uncharacterized protein n=1 Tax=Pleuronectes platessa TaxID=8262 RepID=A0A9N7U1A5_PLEPL|nr:unnamed protein product [Pleuronectes platessa]
MEFGEMLQVSKAVPEEDAYICKLGRVLNDFLQVPRGCLFLSRKFPVELLGLDDSSDPMRPSSAAFLTS